MIEWIAADAYDAEMTHEGLAHHYCVEGNEALGLHPSRGQLYLYEARNEVPLMAMGFFIHKLKRKGTTLIFIGMATGAASIHITGGTEWAAGCW